MNIDLLLAVILPCGEIIRILECIDNIKHLTMIGLLYVYSVCISEVVNLKVGDISIEELYCSPELVIYAVKERGAKKELIS